MSGKLSFLVGLGAGYVLGARAGRERYEQIASKAQDLWQDPRVQEKAGQAQDLAREKGAAAASAVAEKATDTGAKVVGKAKDTARSRGGDSDSEAHGAAGATGSVRPSSEPAGNGAGNGAGPGATGEPGVGSVGGAMR